MVFDAVCAGFEEHDNIFGGNCSFHCKLVQNAKNVPPAEGTLIIYSLEQSIEKFLACFFHGIFLEVEENVHENVGYGISEVVGLMLVQPDEAAQIVIEHFGDLLA